MFGNETFIVYVAKAGERPGAIEPRLLEGAS